SASVTTDFRFIAHPAETDPDKFATERVGNRLAEARLADAGRAEKTEDRPVPLRVQFAHRQIFDQPLFYFFEIVMIAIEDLLCLIEIEIVLAQFIPGQIGNDLDVTDNDGKFRAGRWNKIEPLQFAFGLLH